MMLDWFNWTNHDHQFNFTSLFNYPACISKHYFLQLQHHKWGQEFTSTAKKVLIYLATYSMVSALSRRGIYFRNATLRIFKKKKRKSWKCRHIDGDASYFMCQLMLARYHLCNWYQFLQPALLFRVSNWCSRYINCSASPCLWLMKLKYPQPIEVEYINGSVLLVHLRQQEHETWLWYVIYRNGMLHIQQGHKLPKHSHNRRKIEK